jgi:hypothetical protein
LWAQLEDALLETKTQYELALDDQRIEAPLAAREPFRALRCAVVRQRNV